MKSYKDYEEQALGSSDIAVLTVRTCEDSKFCGKKTGLFNLSFGSDGDYSAYIVDKDAIIGEHYTEVVRGKNWVKIYDDTGRVFETKAKEIRIYRAGEYGCIIQVIDTESEEDNE